MPGPSSEVNEILTVVRGYAQACLDDLQRMPHPPRAEAVVEAAGDWTVLTIAYSTPSGADVPGLSSCDRDCLALLARAVEPLSGYGARAELERRDLGIWGLATVKRSLVRLKRSSAPP